MGGGGGRCGRRGRRGGVDWREGEALEGTVNRRCGRRGAGDGKEGEVWSEY